MTYEEPPGSENFTPAEWIHEYANRLLETHPDIAADLHEIARTHLTGIQYQAWNQGMGDAKLQALGLKVVRVPYDPFQ